MDPRARSSPLYDVQARAGATFVTWQGAEWARDFGDPVAEHHAVRCDAGVWDMSPLCIWEVRGARALEAVGRAFTNDLRAAAPGHIRYGLLCADDGTIVNDATVFVFGPDRVWVLTSMTSDIDHLREHAAGRDAGVARREGLAAVQLQGPRSLELLTALGVRLDDLPFFRFHPRPRPIRGARCLVARLGFSGELGYELFCPAAQAESLWSALVEAGARPYGFAAVQTLRIEAGLVLLGEDFVTRCTTPFDVSLDRFVSVGTHNFAGRDALARIARAAPRRLVTLAVDGERVPSAGAVVWAAEGPAGRVTSACLSPSYGRVVALARVDSAVAVPRRRLLVQVGDRHVPATVHAEPLHDADGRRRRADPRAPVLTSTARVSARTTRISPPVPAAGDG